MSKTKNKSIINIVSISIFVLFILLIYFLIYYFGFRKDIINSNYIKSMDSCVQTYKITIDEEYTTSNSSDTGGTTYYKKTFYYKINDVEYTLKRDEITKSTSNRTVYYNSKDYSENMLDTDYELIKNKVNFKTHIIVTVFYTAILIILVFPGKSKRNNNQEGTVSKKNEKRRNKK